MVLFRTNFKRYVALIEQKKTISLNEIVLFITYFTPMTKLSRAASTTSVVIVSRLLISNILSIWVKSLWISRKVLLQSFKSTIK